jgi:hypothetical protein
MCLSSIFLIIPRRESFTRLELSGPVIDYIAVDATDRTNWSGGPGIFDVRTAI